jgi:DNA topoisomerase III
VCESVTVSKEKTKPLPLYTEATLLKDLQRVAKYVKDPKIRQLLKDRDAGKTGEHGGIGTPATRASMLETLQKRGFYTVEKKKLIPTELGLSFIASLPEIATAPDMTALWHEQQQMIEQGSFTVDEFLDALEDFIASQVNNVDLSGMSDGVPQTQSSQRPRLTAVCPKCNGAVVISAKVYACSGCELKVWGEVASKKLTLPQAETLFSKGKTAVLEGFKSKAGKPFDAKLVLDTATGKVSFEFENKK